MYKTVNDADVRLTGTVILFEGRPVLVDAVRPAVLDGVTPELLFRGHPFNGERLRFECSDPRFDFKTPPLGYINYFAEGNRHVIFGERLPVRRGKQGLTGENTQFTTTAGYRVDWTRMRDSAGFDECVRGIYPDWQTALERLIPDSSIAVSRDFAIVCDAAGGYTLMYRRAKVGIFFRQQLYVTGDKQWLMETIAEEPNLPNNAEVM